MLLAPDTPSLPRLLLKPGRWTVGSAATCSHQIAAEGVRPRHALLVCGSQTTVLKAWDPHTWHNGQPVLGEVRLRPGDCIKIGSVEFQFESTGTSGVVALRSDEGSTTVSESRNTRTLKPDGWELDRLREQIQELRDELARRVIRRPETEVASAPDAQTIADARRLSARIAELEEAAAEARSLTQQTQEELAAARAEQSRREADFADATRSLESVLDSTQQEVSRLHAELEQQHADAAQRAQAWEQQVSEWGSERERSLQELSSLENARRQLVADWEQEQSARQADAARWQEEVRRLQADFNQQQSAWHVERDRILEQSQRSEESALQTQRAITDLQKELAAQSQQLLADRHQIEADKGQLAAERQRLESEQQQLAEERGEREKAIAELAEERKRIEQHAAEVRPKFEDLTQRLTEFEAEKAHLSREQQALEHSWNWLHSDRRKLAEEKDQWQQQRAEWQADQERLQTDRAQFEQERVEQEREASTADIATGRDQLEADWQQLQSAQTEWARHREETDAQWQASFEELKNARAELYSQEQAINEAQARINALSAELEAHVAEIDHERQRLAAERETISRERLDWEEQRTSWQNAPRDLSTESWSGEPTPELETTRAEEFASDGSLTPLVDDWSVGVDLTASRELHAGDPAIAPEIPSDWETSDETRSSDDVSPRADLSEQPELATEWDQPPSSPVPTDVATPAQSTALPGDSWEAPLAPVAAADNSEQVDPAVAVLREQLADLFHLPELREPSSRSEDHPSSSAITNDTASTTTSEEWASEESTSEEWTPGEPTSEVATSEVATSEVATSEKCASDEPTWEESTSEESASVESTDTVIDSAESPVADHNAPDPNADPVANDQAPAESAGKESAGSTVSVLESMAFTEEEDVDDSVSRYMQHLLARSQAGSVNREDKYIPASSIKESVANTGFNKPPSTDSATTDLSNRFESQQLDLTTENPGRETESPSQINMPAARLRPVHKQDKDAIRAATEQMRQVANHQTLKNVETSNWNRIKRSIKTKSSLAAFSFVLSAGMFFLGYQYKPGFLVLGVCATGLGLMTWVDLFIAIREARARTAQLAVKKKTDPEQE